MHSGERHEKLVIDFFLQGWLGMMCLGMGQVGSWIFRLCVRDAVHAATRT